MTGTIRRAPRRLLLSLACVALLAPSTRAAKPDLSSPKAAVVSLGNAMLNDDAEAGVAATNVPAEQKSTWEQTIHLGAALNRLNEVAVQKWGDEGRTLLMGPGGAKKGAPRYKDLAQRVRDMEQAEVKVDGDSATVTPKGEDEQPITCKKTDGQWKVDLSSLPWAQSGGRAAALAPVMAKASREVADDIKADKFKTVTEAQQALYAKVAAAQQQQEGKKK